MKDMIEKGSHYFIGYCYDGDMRLVDGETNWEGRLEMCQDGRWGTIAAESETWGETNYRFACNALGFQYNGKVGFFNTQTNYPLSTQVQELIHPYHILCQSQFS